MGRWLPGRRGNMAGGLYLLTPARGAPCGPKRKSRVVLAVAFRQQQNKRRPKGANYGSGRVPAHILSRHSPHARSAPPGPAPATPTPSGGPVSWPRWLATPRAPPRPQAARTGPVSASRRICISPRGRRANGQNGHFSCQPGRDHVSTPPGRYGRVQRTRGRFARQGPGPGPAGKEKRGRGVSDAADPGVACGVCGRRVFAP